MHETYLGPAKKYRWTCTGLSDATHPLGVVLLAAGGAGTLPRVSAFFWYKEYSVRPLLWRIRKMQEKDLTFGEMLDKLIARAAFYHDENIVAKELRMNPENGNITHAVQSPEGEVSVREFSLLPWGLRTLGPKLGIPVGYIQRCPPYLRATNVNHWFDVMSDKVFFVRFDSIDGEPKIRAFLSEKYADFPNVRLAEMLAENMDEKYAFTVSYTDDGCRFTGEIVSGSDQFSDDEHASAIWIGNSEIGQHKLTFRTMLYNKALKSGVILKTLSGFDEKHIGDKKWLAGSFKEAVISIMLHCAKNLQSLQDLKRINLEDVNEMLDIICESNRLTETHKSAVRRAIATIQPKTLYDVVMVFTAASTDPDCTPREREALQIVGGNVMMNAKRYGRWRITPEQMLEERKTA